MFSKKVNFVIFFLLTYRISVALHIVFEAKTQHIDFTKLHTLDTSTQLMFQKNPNVTQLGIPGVTKLFLRTRFGEISRGKYDFGASACRSAGGRWCFAALAVGAARRAYARVGGACPPYRPAMIINTCQAVEKRKLPKWTCK